MCSFDILRIVLFIHTHTLHRLTLGLEGRWMMRCSSVHCNAIGCALLSCFPCPPRARTQCINYNFTIQILLYGCRLSVLNCVHTIWHSAIHPPSPVSPPKRAKSRIFAQLSNYFSAISFKCWFCCFLLIYKQKTKQNNSVLFIYRVV